MESPLRIETDYAEHKKWFLRGFIAATIYSIFYGIYEYFIVYHYPRWIEILTPIVNWSIMYAGVVIVVALSTKFSVEKAIMGLMYMAMLEDVIYWMCQWIDYGVYPFPAGNWWDSTLATFRILGGLGRPLPFWPYVPTYYIPGFAMALGYYIIGMKGAKHARIYAWTVGPLFLGIIAGALWEQDIIALIMLITIPLVSYIYVLILLYLKKKN